MLVVYSKAYDLRFPHRAAHLPCARWLLRSLLSLSPWIPFFCKSFISSFEKGAKGSLTAPVPSYVQISITTSRKLLNETLLAHWHPLYISSLRGLARASRLAHFLDLYLLIQRDLPCFPFVAQYYQTIAASDEKWLRILGEPIPPDLSFLPDPEAT